MKWALIMLGAPGAGKGTQSRGISKCFGIPHISTGDILRNAVREQTPLGLAAQREMLQGRLVPDKVVCGLVKERLGQADASEGFILDGFPRTVAQAKYLGKLLQSQEFPEPQVVNIDVDPEVLIKRMTGRRSCPVCGQIYNIYFNPPRVAEMCDRECARLIHRADDNEETIRRRFAEYDRQTKPLIDYYSRRGQLHHFDGSGAPEDIAERLCKFLTQVSYDYL